MSNRIIAPLVLGFAMVGLVADVALAHRGSGRVEPMLLAYGENPDMSGHPGMPGETQGSGTRSNGKGRSNKSYVGWRNALNYCAGAGCTVLDCWDTGVFTTRCQVRYRGEDRIYEIECGNDRGDNCW